MQTLIINGQEKETKCSKGWLGSYGRQWNVQIAVKERGK